MLIIPATLEAKLRRITVRGQSRPHLQNNQSKNGVEARFKKQRI
jgi:hypothetical protein